MPKQKKPVQVFEGDGQEPYPKIFPIAIVLVYGKGVGLNHNVSITKEDCEKLTVAYNRRVEPDSAEQDLIFKIDIDFVDGSQKVKQARGCWVLKILQDGKSTVVADRVVH